MKEYILEVKKLIPENFCKKIIEYFPVQGDATIGSKAEVRKDIRNCKGNNIPENLDTFGKIITHNYIKSRIEKVAEIYSEKWPYMTANKITEINLLQYDANEHKAGYTYHTDDSIVTPKRTISISICLSNNFTGGEFVFDLNKDGEYQLPQNIGDCVAFPSNFMFPHSVRRVTKGTRYALISWIA